MHGSRHLLSLVLFGAGVILGAFKLVAPAVACVSAGLFVEAF